MRLLNFTIDHNLSYLQQCTDGTYASARGMSACETCPEGQYCLPVVPANATLNAQDCPPGYYCPAGKSFTL